MPYARPVGRAARYNSPHKLGRSRPTLVDCGLSLKRERRGEAGAASPRKRHSLWFLVPAPADDALGSAGYARAFPDLFSKDPPKFRERDANAALDVAVVLQNTGEGDRAKALLDRSEISFQSIPRMGAFGSGFSDARILALRGDGARALAALREAERAGYRNWWRYYRDLDPALASIRNEPEFKAIFADIERDMARQRARLAARAKATTPALTGN
jgi:hypothetical protein